jgi:protein-S-isoprenylcysteine O-methyltransferase Ste14
VTIKPPQLNNDNPEIITFPTAIFATFFITGIISDRALNYNLLFDGFRHPFGWAIILIGLILYGWASKQFFRGMIYTKAKQPAVAIVTKGPYKFSRNPMYLAASMVYLGLSITFGKTITLVFLIPCLAVLHYGVILREENHLKAKFGDQYLKYQSKVRRWI